MRRALLALVTVSLVACSSPKRRSLEDDDDRPRAKPAASDDVELLRAHLDDIAARGAAPAAPGSASANRRYAIRGPADQADPHVARLQALADAREFGLVGVGDDSLALNGHVGQEPPPSGALRTKPPQVRMGATSVSGRLPPEVIQRIVRQNFGRFRLCYEHGLRTDPNLTGQVSVSFTIGTDGSVSGVTSGGTMPDETVRECVTKAFYGLSFPQPEGGVVKVTYPISFSPGTHATIAGKAPKDVQTADVTDALKHAGCTDVTVLAQAAPADPVMISAKRNGRAFTITFVPSSGTALDEARLAKLRTSGAVATEGAGFVLAIVDDAGDPVAAKELLDLVVVRS